MTCGEKPKKAKEKGTGRNKQRKRTWKGRYQGRKEKLLSKVEHRGGKKRNGVLCFENPEEKETERLIY